MKEIIRRALIVSWLISIAGVFIGIYNFGPFDPEAWGISFFLATVNWMLQYILLGVVSPFALVGARTDR